MVSDFFHQNKDTILPKADACCVIVNRLATEEKPSFEINLVFKLTSFINEILVLTLRDYHN